MAPRGGVRASCGRAAGGLRSGARISHAKLIPPRHAGRPPARGCAVLGRAAVSSPLRPLRPWVPCRADPPASSTPRTCQLSASASASAEGRGVGPRTLATSLSRPERAARCRARVPASRGPGAQSYSGLGCQLHGDRRTADRSSPLVLQPVRVSQQPRQARATLAPTGSPRGNGLRGCAPCQGRSNPPLRCPAHLPPRCKCPPLRPRGNGALCAAFLGSRSCGSGGRASTQPTAGARTFKLSLHSCS